MSWIKIDRIALSSARNIKHSFGIHLPFTQPPSSTLLLSCSRHHHQPGVSSGKGFVRKQLFRSIRAWVFLLFPAASSSARSLFPFLTPPSWIRIELNLSWLDSLTWCVLCFVCYLHTDIETGIYLCFTISPYLTLTLPPSVSPILVLVYGLKKRIFISSYSFPHFDCCLFKSWDEMMRRSFALIKNDVFIRK